MRKAWFILLVFLSMIKLNGQNISSYEAVLKEKFSSYCTSVPWEELYIHSDRNEYVAGEDMWLMAYLFDRQKNLLADYNTIAYFEVINPDNHQVIKTRISIEKGTGPGHVVLPDTLSSGRYVIRAYTNWMKNFLPSNCFMQEISIHNALNDRPMTGMHKKKIEGQYYSNSSKTALNQASKGILMKIDNQKPDKLNIELDLDSGNSAGSSDNYILLIQTHGVINLIRSLSLTDKTAKISLPKEILSPGINQVIVFNGKLEPLCEKYIYTPIKNVDTISINSSDRYKIREKVDMEIETGKSETESAKQRSYSISVVSGTGKGFSKDIEEYMVFGSEFGILPESLRHRHLKDISQEAVDSFIVNAKSNWIDWDRVMSGNFPVISYKMEKDCHFLTGRLVNRNTMAAESGKYLFMSAPGKVATFQYSKTDINGAFSFTLPISGQNKDLILQPESADLNSSIKISSGFSEESRIYSDKTDSAVSDISDYLTKWGVNYQVNKIYGITFSGEPVHPELTLTKPLRFYGRPDISLRMDDYIKLPVMEEVFFELTPGVLLKKKKNSYYMAVYDPVSSKPYEKPPVVLVDGVIINDPGIVASMEPENVERIEAVKDLYLVGDYLFFGIVNIITRAGDYSNITIPDYAVRLGYRAVDPVASFSSPVYLDDNSKKSRIPDFRNTLYWNPSTTAKSDGIVHEGFWTSDEPGSFEIVIQGVNLKGQPVSSHKIIHVE